MGTDQVPWLWALRLLGSGVNRVSFLDCFWWLSLVFHLFMPWRCGYDMTWNVSWSFFTIDPFLDVASGERLVAVCPSKSGVHDVHTLYA